MGKTVFSHAERRNLLFKAANYRESSWKRSSARHALMDMAEALGDGSLWTEVGVILVDACRVDDLSAQVSDHFVDYCPESVFAKFTDSCPRHRFRGWRNRAIKIKKGEVK